MRVAAWSGHVLAHLSETLATVEAGSDVDIPWGGSRRRRGVYVDIPRRRPVPAQAARKVTQGQASTLDKMYDALVAPQIAKARSELADRDDAADAALRAGR